MEMHSRGQMFASYRILIGFIFAFAVLLIILGALDYFHKININISNERVYGGVNDAVSTPNGDVVLIDDLLFDPITYTARSFETHTGLPAECFTLKARSGTTNFSNPSDYQVSINSPVATNVYAKCETTFSQDCEIACTVSFGEKLE